MTNADLAQDLVFEENYLGKTDATFTLNFSTGSSMVLAQYYNFVRSAAPATPMS
jgi:glutamate decarboxylase